MTSIDAEWRHGPGVLSSVWRYRYLVVLVTLVAAVIGYLVSASGQTTYESTARLFLSDPRGGGVFDRQASVDPERYVPQQAERVTSTPVLERAVELLGGGIELRTLDRRLSARGDITLNLLTITATASEPEAAAERANAAATAYQDVARDVRLEAAQRAVDELRSAEAELDREIQELRQTQGETTEALVQQQLDVLVGQRIEVSSRAQQLLVDARIFGSGVDVVEAAEPPNDPVAPRPRRAALLAALVAAALATGGAYWLAGTVRRVESRHAPHEILGVPLLGTVPVVGRRDVRTLDDWIALESADQEAYHFLMASIEYAMHSMGARSVLVTSATPGEGKTETCLQLAVGAVVDGRHIVLVDGDLRMAALTRKLHLQERPGLVDSAAGGRRPDAFAAAVQRMPIFAGERALPVLPSGDFAEVGSASIRDAGVARGLGDLARAHDLVIVDSAPLLATADTTVLANYVDAVMLVVREGTKLSTLEEMRERLRFVSTPVLGYAYVTREAPALPDYGYTADRAAHVARRPEERSRDIDVGATSSTRMPGDGPTAAPRHPRDVAAAPPSSPDDDLWSSGRRPPS